MSSGCTHVTRRRLFAGASALAAGIAVSRAPVAAAQAGLPARGDFLIRNAYILTMDPKLGDLPDADIHVRDGVILAVGKALDAPAATPIDGRATIVLPGLIETHWHMWNTLARNLAGDTDATGYFPMQLALGARFSPEDNARGVRLALTEAIASGITTVHDWSHNLLTPAHADAELAVLRATGIRGRFSYGYSRNTKTGDTLPFDDILRVQREWFAFPGDRLLTFGIAPKGPETNTVEVCKKEWDFARSAGLPITTHVSMYPKKHDAIKRLYDGGLLGPDVQLIHATNASAAEIDMIGSTGTHVSMSPYTEMRTGFGFGPVGEVLKTGVPLSLSVDTVALCGNADMLGIMRGIQNVENGRKQSEFALPARKALEMATIDGARDLGIADLVGSLVPGKRADLIMVRTDPIQNVPLNDAVRTIVQSAQAADVDTVIIDGRILKRHGRLTTIDVERIARDATSTMARSAAPST